MQFDCDARGNPTPSTQWAQNGQMLEKENNSSEAFAYMKTSSGLVLTGVMRSAAGIWTCHTFNEAGSDSVSHELVVEWPPTSKLLDVTFAVKTAILGESVQFKCPVDANPPAEFSWFFNDEKLEPHKSWEYSIDRSTGI